ncbi:MAG: ABC transporter ATP-binding protein, partial [Bdellovibrionota bacterium]
KVHESPGTSLLRWEARNAKGECVFRARFSNRQKACFTQIKIRIEEARKEGARLDPDATVAYRAALLRPLDEVQAAVSSGRARVLWRLIAYLKPYRRRMIIGLLGATGYTISLLLPPYFTGRLIDEVLAPYARGDLGGEQGWSLARIFLGGVALAYLARESFAFLRQRTMSVLGEHVAYDLREGLFSHLQKLGMTFYSAKQTGTIITRVTSDTDRIWDFIAFGVVEASVAVLQLVGLSIALLSLDWRLALAVVLPTPLLLWSIVRHGRKMEPLFIGAWRRWSRMNEVLSDTVPGIRVVRAFVREKHEGVRFQTRNADALEQFNRIHARWTGFWPRLMLSVHALGVLAWWFGLPRVFGVDGFSAAPLTTGTFVAFLFYLGLYLQPIEAIGQVSRMLNRATTSAYRIFEILDTPLSVTDAVDATHPEVEGGIEFRDVRFSYDGIRPILQGLSFSIASGEFVGIVGPSGGGKSTLTNLIPRFYDVTSGSVRIDGVDVRGLDSGCLRGAIAMVQQDPFLFRTSILENIRYGRPEASLREVVEAARAANAHGFILKLPQGYDTVVGERGHTLSGGERQRISIARAVLANPRILILDEATSAVDTETEREIQEALDRVARGRTVLAIAHRLSTLQRADRLLYVEEGRVVEEGSHAVLLAREAGKYKKLHDIQVLASNRHFL